MWLGRWRGWRLPKTELLQWRVWYAGVDRGQYPQVRFFIPSKSQDKAPTRDRNIQSRIQQQAWKLPLAAGGEGLGMAGVVGGLATLCLVVALAGAEHPCPAAYDEDASASLLIIFRPQQLEQPCPGGTDTCNSPMPRHWAALCTFPPDSKNTWTEYMLCSPEQRDAILKYYMASEKQGVFGPLLTFSPCDLWPAIRGRSLWVVGDSHSYDLFHALACLLGGLWDYQFSGPLPVETEGPALEAMAKHVARYRHPECLTLLENTLVCFLRVNHGHVLLGHALLILSRIAQPGDVAVVNFAQWHGAVITAEYLGLLREFRKVVEEGAGTLPHMVWMEATPKHYMQQHGHFPGGEPPYECSPLHVELQADGTIVATDDWSDIVVQGGSYNKAAREVFGGSDIVMTQFWNSTVEVWIGHRLMQDGRGQECAHHCFLGVPSVWAYHLFLAIRDAPWSPLRN